MNKTISKLFRQSFTLEPGIYQYKFIVEDEEENREWFYDICRPNCDDGSGNWNNLIQVEPRIEKNNFYITTAINYTNGSPHFGHAYEAISGDTIARYHRVAGKNVFFVTGTDEHGQKVAEAARAIGMEPLELCDKYVAEFRGLNAKLNVSEDFYIRTTMKKHEEQCLWLWKKATEAGDIYLGKYEGWYNVREEKFVTETEAEKSDFKDPGSGKPLRKTSEASYFFRMSKYQQRLLEHIYDHPEFIFPEEREAEILSRLREPLLDLSISRTTFDWGITAPVPKNGKEKHVMYVWFDALTNYISAVDYPKGKLAKYWPADIHLIGKDIAWFHSVIWPCMLMSTGIPLPRSIVCHGFVNGPDGRKMSKSFGNVIDLFELLGSYSSDNLRYFVMREGVFGNDFSLSIPALILRHDAELADDLGNLVHRSLKLSSLWCDSKVPEAPFTELFSLEELKETVEKHMVELRIQQALEAVLLGVKSTNKFLADISPWNLPEEEIKTKLMCVRTALEAVYILSHFYAFLIPDSAQKIFDHLGSPMTTLNKLKGWGNLTPGTSIIFSKQDVLFRKIQDNRFEKKQKREAHKEADRIGGSGGGGDGGNSKANEGGQDGGDKGGGAKGGGAKGGGAKGGGAKGGGNKGGKGGAKAANNKPMDIARLNLRVGKIISCKNHPKAAHLYVEEIDIGESKYRQVVSGLANHIPLEEMVDKLVVVVANLKPSKFKEVESQAMLIAATGEDGTVSLVHPPSSATPGEVITVEGYHGDPDVVIDSRKVDVISALKPDMKTDALGVACYCGVQWMTTSGPCTTNQQNAFLG